MNDFIDKYLKPLKVFWQKLSKKLKIIILSALGFVVIVSVVVATILGRTEYAVLFSNITPEQAVEVTAALTSSGTVFQTKNNGTTILVDKKQEPLIRMNLASSGSPKVTPNFDFFTSQVDFMTTESEKRSLKLWQMYERMQDSIETIQGIKSAIVTVVLPEENSYAWQAEKFKPTGSVQVTLEDGVTLAPSQVAAIKKVAANSNLGMKPEDVSVVDNGTGNELKSSDDNSFVDINNFKLDIEKRFETDIRNNILRVMTPIFGEQNLAVSVKSTASLDKKIKEIISHTPSTEDDKGIVQNSEVDKENIRPKDDVGGTVGAEDNADLPTYEGVTVDGDSVYYKDYEKYEYAVNTTTEQITSDAVIMENVGVSISIDKGVRSLTDDEIQSLLPLVANAAGTSAAKVEIINLEFQKDKALAEKTPGIFDDRVIVVSVSAGALLLVILIIVFIIVAQSKKKKRLAQLSAETEGRLAAEANAAIIPVGDTPNIEEDMKNTPESREHALRKEIQEFSGKNPQIVAQLIKTWLRGEGDD